MSLSSWRRVGERTRLRTTDPPGLPRAVFQVLAEREEKNSVAIASNESFSEWGQVFGDEVLATAIFDRLLHHCEVISINGPSYRLKDRLKAIERDNDGA
jgi:hypothetical protein